MIGAGKEVIWTKTMLLLLLWQRYHPISPEERSLRNFAVRDCRCVQGELLITSGAAQLRVYQLGRG